jgi:hypothetical protein
MALAMASSENQTLYLLRMKKSGLGIPVLGKDSVPQSACRACRHSSEWGNAIGLPGSRLSEPVCLFLSWKWGWWEYHSLVTLHWVCPLFLILPQETTGPCSPSSELQIWHPRSSFGICCLTRLLERPTVVSPWKWYKSHTNFREGNFLENIFKTHENKSFLIQNLFSKQEQQKVFILLVI